MKKFQIMISAKNDDGDFRCMYNQIMEEVSKEKMEEYVKEKIVPNFEEVRAVYIVEIEDYRYSIKFNWSENALLNAIDLLGKEMPFAVGNAILEELNKNHKGGGYDKTEYEITDLVEGGSMSRRYDIGTEVGNVLDQLKYTVKYAKKNPNDYLVQKNQECYNFWENELIPELGKEDELYISWCAGNKWKERQYSILLDIAENFGK